MAATGISIEQLTGSIQATLKNLGRMKMTDLTTDVQQYPLLDMWIMGEGKFMDTKPGTGLQFNANLGVDSSYRRPGLFSEDQVTAADSVVQGSVDWRHSEVSTAWDIREKGMNQGPEVIFDLIKTRISNMHSNLADGLAEDAWGKPANSNNTDQVYGIPYWITKNTSSTGGFDGGNPSGFTAGKAGIDATNNARWRNWTDVYANVTADDLLKKMREAATKIKFTPPRNVAGKRVPEYGGTGNPYAYFAPYSVISEMESILESRNENLGMSLDPMDGKVRFRGAPVHWEPQLDSDTSAPIYMINSRVIRGYRLKGHWLKDTVRPASNQHTVVNYFVDATWQIMATDLRPLAVICTTG